MLDDLSLLAARYDSDKLQHGFTPFYYGHLEHRREKIRKVMEIGVRSGASLLMWRDYFSNAEIHGVDINQPVFLELDRISEHVADQSDRSALNKLLESIGSEFDLIIDDGGHTMSQQQVSFGHLFPHVNPGGLYIIKDLHTSFIESIGVTNSSGESQSYSTEIEEGIPTTNDVVVALASRKAVAPPFMIDNEYQYIEDNSKAVSLFDKNSDHAHMTAIIEKA